jgi:hypothetical protein
LSAPVAAAVAAIRAWGEARDWRGYDPYDALNSPLAPLLTLRTGIGRRLFTQAVKLAPVNVRPALGIRPGWNAKAASLVASAYARLAAAREDDAAGRASLRLLEQLVSDSTAATGLGWGYHFDVQTRFFGYRRGTPNAIATSFAAHALLDAHELVDGSGRWLDAAAQACDFLRETLLVEAGGRTYFQYLPGEGELVHNANVLACSVLARTAAPLGRPDLEETAREALSSTLSAQSADGSWPYSETHGWIDNFHTGYVLEGLAVCDRLDPTIRSRLEIGLDFWERELFLADGTPKYYAGRVFPVDAHNYAQAIETWLSVAPWRPGALPRAERCAAALVERMLTRDGHIAFQRRRLWTSTVPFVRWTTAPAFRALARLELMHAHERAA